MPRYGILRQRSGRAFERYRWWGLLVPVEQRTKSIGELGGHIFVRAWQSKSCRGMNQLLWQTPRLTRKAWRSFFRLRRHPLRRIAKSAVNCRRFHPETREAGDAVRAITWTWPAEELPICTAGPLPDFQFAD